MKRWLPFLLFLLLAGTASAGLITIAGGRGVAQPSTDDWATRSSGASFSNRLDDQDDLDDWVLLNGNQDHVTLDTSIKVPGAAASYLFTIEPDDSANSGDVRVPVGTFGQGTVAWGSYRVRANYAAAYTGWLVNAQSGMKLTIFSYSGASSVPNETVIQLNNQAGVFSSYHQDGSGSPGYELGFASDCSGSDFRDQPAFNLGSNPLTGNNPDTGSAWSACLQDARQYGLLYSRRSSPGAEAFRVGYGDPLTAVPRLHPDEWHTVTFRLATGTWGANDSEFAMWVAREGEPYVQVFDETGVKLGSYNDQNTLWLTPYVTNRSGGGRTTGAISGLSGVTARLAGKGTHLGTATIEYVASTGLFRFKTAHDSYGAAHGFSVANGITTINLRSSTDAVSTTLNGSHTLPDSTIDLTNASSFPSTGTYVVGTPDTTLGGVGEQLVQCTGKTSNQLTGCTGGSGVRASGNTVTVASYIVLELTDASLLPSSGTTEGTLTISDGRPEGKVWFNDVIFHNTDTPINAPGGYAPE